MWNVDNIFVTCRRASPDGNALGADVIDPDAGLVDVGLDLEVEEEVDISGELMGPVSWPVSGVETNLKKWLVSYAVP